MKAAFDFARISTGQPSSSRRNGPIAIQEQLGSDVAMVFDHVVALPNSREVVADAMRRSVRWAERCRAAATRDDQALFAIVQGGLDAELRAESAEKLVAMDFVGYAIGGLSVGEPPPEMYAALDVTTPLLPRDRPRYLMGVGRPIDLLEGDQPRRRPVRLRDAHAQRPQRAGVYRFRPGSAAQSAALAWIASRSIRRALAWRAGTAGGICVICFRPAKCWGRCSSRCTT